MQRTRVDQNGRVLVPAAIRRALGLREGSELLVTLDPHGRVVLTTPEGAWGRVATLVSTPPARSVVDELLADRRADARGEADDDSAANLLGA